MIFVTVGSQTPFSRLVHAVDEWAKSKKRKDIFAQIGQTKWHPKYIKWTDFLDKKEFDDRIKKADLIIAHAGMGSIITALENNKPILVFPKRWELNEHRNNHQVHTAKKFLELGKIYAAFNKKELIEKLNNIDELKVKTNIKNKVSKNLIKTIKDFINKENGQF